jgi:hypothetical protein
LTHIRLVGVYSGRINRESDLGFVWKVEALAAILANRQRGPLPTVGPPPVILANEVANEGISACAELLDYSENLSAPGPIRTADLSLRRRALYPLSYGRNAYKQAVFMPRGQRSGGPNRSHRSLSV